VPPSEAVIALLQQQLAAANAQVVDLTIAARAADDKCRAMEANVGALREIAATSVQRLRVALGHSAGAVAQSDEALLAEHATLRAQFETKFKAGGVASVAAPEAEQPEQAFEVDPTRLARIKATRLTK